MKGSSLEIRGVFLLCTVVSFILDYLYIYYFHIFFVYNYIKGLIALLPASFILYLLFYHFSEFMLYQINHTFLINFLFLSCCWTMI